MAMPITLRDAPDTLPAHARDIYVSAWNAAYEDTCKSRSDRDQCASKIAWSAVKNKYHQDKDSKWLTNKADLSPGDARRLPPGGAKRLCEVSMVITKASLQPDGTIRWQAVTSDTEPDNLGEATSLALFQDWINRAETKQSVPWLPDPRKPFLGVSHYSYLNGFGEAGSTEKMYIDGNRFKAGGVSSNNSIGQSLFATLKSELDLTQKGQVIDKPIRISAAWWDIEHSHGPFIFTRKSLTDVCPMCEKGEGNKVYLKGQLDHFAATRVPINPRTSLVLTERAMTITRQEDAASIVDPDLAEELEEKSRLVGKSETASLITKAKDKDKMTDDGEEMDEGEMMEEEDMDKGKMKKKHEQMHKARTIITTDEFEEIDDSTDEPPNPEMKKKPLGGAITMSAARAHLQIKPQKAVYTRLELMQLVKRNIAGLPAAEQIEALAGLIDEVNDEVQEIKTAVEDLYWLQPAVEDDTPLVEEAPTMSNDYLDKFSETVTTALEGSEPTEQKAATIQKALNDVALALKAELETEPGGIAAALKAALSPLSEQLAQLNARLGATNQPVVTIPVQKSVTVPTMVEVQPQNQLPTSPITGQPSGLTQMVRRSVGLY